MLSLRSKTQNKPQLGALNLGVTSRMKPEPSLESTLTPEQIEKWRQITYQCTGGRRLATDAPDSIKLKQLQIDSEKQFDLIIEAARTRRRMDENRKYVRAPSGISAVALPAQAFSTAIPPWRHRIGIHAMHPPCGLERVLACWRCSGEHYVRTTGTVQQIKETNDYFGQP